MTRHKYYIRLLAIRYRDLPYDYYCMHEYGIRIAS